MGKEWWRNPALWGGFMVLVAFVSSFLGVTISSEEGTAFVNAILKLAEAVSVLVGLIMVLVDRIKASREINTLKMEVKRLNARRS